MTYFVEVRPTFLLRINLHPIRFSSVIPTGSIVGLRINPNEHLHQMRMCAMIVRTGQDTRLCHHMLLSSDTGFRQNTRL